MNLKESPLALKNKNAKVTKVTKDYPTIADLMKEQKITNRESNTVHHRRDLDSLG